MAKSKRGMVLVLVLALLVCVGLANAAHIHWLTRDLARAAQTAIDEERNAHPDAEGVQLATELTVTKAFVVFGAPAGKLTVFVRSEFNGQEPQTSIFESFYVRQAGEWVMTESGRCRDGACAVRAEKAFLSLDAGREH
jgi:hypothetical protein